MDPSALNSSKLIRTAAFMVSLSVILVIMILAKSFVIPLAWSLMIALASFQMLDAMERKFRISRLVSSLLFVALIFLILIVLFYFLYHEITMVIDGIPSFSSRLIAALQTIPEFLNRYGIDVPPIDKEQIHGWLTGHSEMISGAIATFGKVMGQVVLVNTYLFFMLYYRDNYIYYIRLKKKDEHDFQKAREEAIQVGGVISGYLNGTFRLTLLLAVMLYAIFLIIGLKFAFFFAILLALLGLVPNLGTPIGTVIVVLFALVTGDGFKLPLLALGGIILANTLIGYIFEPRIMGDQINLNAFVLFIAVIIGGLIWGVSGMILFVPYAAITRVILESNESTRPLAALFATLPEGALPSARPPERESEN